MPDTPELRIRRTNARRLEVERLLDLTQEWAKARTDVRGLALVGSWARGDARADSDVDLVLLTVRKERYVADDDWLRHLGCQAVVGTAARGPVIERRVRMPSGLEVEFCVAPLYWASLYPVDSGTRRVAEEGMRVLHDPDCLLRALVRVVYDRSIE
jgi:hypothetical protein